jgi:four helix bundle protein
MRNEDRAVGVHSCPWCVEEGNGYAPGFDLQRRLDVKGDNISDRLMDLAIFCSKLVARLGATAIGRHYAGQLARCSSGAGANYEEARSAESRADFIHKIGVAAKEVRETYWWLRFLDRGRIAPVEDIARWAEEANQLVCILTASVRTARARPHPPRST